MPHITVLLPPFLTEAAILNRESDAGNILKIFACSLREWAKEGEDSRGEDGDDHNNNEGIHLPQDLQTPSSGQLVSK